MNNSRKEDRRIAKTEKCIRDAFINIIGEKEISHITIKELAEAANINRKTFYMHYSCIDDLIDKIENETIHRLVSTLKKYDFFDTQFDVYAFFNSINEVINDDFNFYQQLYRSNNNNFLITKIKDILKGTIIDEYKDKVTFNKEILSLYSEHAASGIIAIYVEWFRTGSSMTLEDLGKIAANISLNGLSSILTIHNNR